VTLTTTTPDVDELMPAARDLAAQERGVPPKRKIQEALSVGFPKASKIYDRLRTEHDERRALGRRRMRSLATRKPSGGPLLARFRPSPAEPVTTAPTREEFQQVAVVTEAPSPAAVTPLPTRVSRWPLLVLAAPAFVAIWAGWVDLGRLAGFGPVTLLPGIADRFQINTAITLPIGLETYAAYAMYVWLARVGRGRARRFAAISALGSLLLGFAGQAAYHLMIAAGMTAAPWPITLAVSGVPVLVLGMGAALWHLVHAPKEK
jgi:hypothetical protein